MFRAINIFHLALRAIISSQIGVQSHQHSQLSVQSHYLFSVLVLKVITILSFGIQSHQHSLLGVQTHHRFSASAFRAITIFSFGVQSHHRSQFDVQSHHHLQFWRSEPSSSSVPAFRAISIFSPAFRATFQALRAFVHLQFNIQSFCLFLVRHSELSYIYSVQRSEPWSQFGVPSHTFSSTLKVHLS